MELAGKKALVTGASRGVGRAIAEAMVAEGIHVFGTSRTPDAAQWPDGVTPVALDASTPETVEAGWREAKLGEKGISIVVNNAGAAVMAEYAEVDFSEWEAQVALLLLSPMKVSHLVLKDWTPENPGILVNVTSLATEYPLPYLSGYNAGKAGLSGFTESLVQDVDSEVGRVIELRLGDLRTGFNEAVERRGSGKRMERVWEAMVRHVNGAPEPSVAARRLMRAIRDGERGVVRSGSFFQTVVASLFGRFVWSSVKRASNLWYYNVKGR